MTAPHHFFTSAAGKPDSRSSDAYAEQPIVFSARNARPRILQAAKDLFADPSCAPSIQDIAAHSGLSRRALYNHFCNMDEVRIGLLHQLAWDLCKSTYPVLSRQAEPRGALTGFLQACALLLHGPVYVQMLRLHRELSAPNVVIGLQLRAMIRKPMVLSLETYLLYRRLGGNCRECDPYDVADRIIRLVEGLISAPPASSFEADDMDTKRSIDLLADMLLSSHLTAKPLVVRS